jgi:hypothetical protein
VCPPRVEVVHHELHHEVLGPFLLIVTLQNEATGSGIEDRDVAVENLLEGRASSVPVGMRLTAESPATARSAGLHGR